MDYPSLTLTKGANMRLRSLNAEYEAKNGSIFHFWLYQGALCVNRDGHPYTTVEDLPAEAFVKECEALMEAWDKAKPH